jgi:starch synthase
VVDCTLEDLAEHKANGFVFDDFSNEGFGSALRRAFTLYANIGDWDAVANRAMQQSFGWQTSAAKYLALYRQIAA